MGVSHGKTLKKCVIAFFGNNNVNQIITFLIIVAGIYVTMISITGQNFLHPLSPVTSKTLDLTNAADEILHSVISCFFITVIAIVVGKLLKFIYVPSLFGFMMVGIAMKNIPEFGDLFYINDYWQFILRKLALVVIIIRWGISINVEFIKNNFKFPLALGLMSANSEGLAIAIVSHFFFNFPATLALICGYVVGTVSPAVCMPTILHLKKKNIGTDKKIADIIPAACCFDNTFSLLIFSLVAAVTYTNDSALPTLVKTIGAIVLAIIAGCIIGWLIRWFPKNDNHHTHMARFSIIASSAFSVITSMIAVGYSFPGICAALALCCVSATKWRTDNSKGISTLVHQYDNLWYFLAAPVLFTLVGFTFDFSQLSLNDLKIALILILIGCLSRCVAAIILSWQGGFNIREQIIIALTLMPKATVQCALAPSLILLTDNFPELRQTTKLIINICIISVIVTSPVVEVLLDLLAPRLLKKSSVSVLSIENSSENTISTQQSERNFDSKSNLQPTKNGFSSVNPCFMYTNQQRPPYYTANNNPIYQN